MLSRRSLLQAGAASLLLSGARFARAESRPQTRAGAPRYFVQVYCRGGIDGVYTMDPKTKADVDADVDVPYGPGDITSAGAHAFGPHFAPLAPWASKMAVVRGVRVQTANHETGSFQILRMRAGVTQRTPALFDVIGEHRDGQPVSMVSLGKLASFEHTPGALEAPTGESDKTTLDSLDALSSDELALLAKTYARHVDSFGTAPLAGTALRTRQDVQQAQALFARLSTSPRFKPKSWGKDNGLIGKAAEDFQRTLWLLENDLTRSVFLKLQFDWDSHYRNADKQTGANASLTFLLDRFLTALEERKNAHGTLASQTVVIVGSELGRFPVINGNLGKDHFPESQFMLFGPGLNVGRAFASTGRRMEGLKVSAKTGLTADVDADHLVLDDLGTTLLHIAGINPELYGYAGKRLRFLEAA